MSQQRVIAERYEIAGIIGQGGMGEVYRGVDHATGQLVAIKLLKPAIVEAGPDLIERFEREGEALRQLDHPNIVKMLASIEEDEKRYLVMEYVSGGSLRALLDRAGPLPMGQALEIALDVADALTRAHRLNIIHRDIKPDNVLLAEDGTPRLTDFGVARLGNRTRLTESGSLMGTFAYLSPEGCRSQDLDARTDVWSFGVMLFEMLAGRRPFEQRQVAAMVFAIINEPVPDLDTLRPDAPPALTRLIEQMLVKDRDQRLRSMRQVGAELEAIMREIDTGVRVPRLSDRPPEPARSRFATPTPPEPPLLVTVKDEQPTQRLSAERWRQSSSRRMGLAGVALVLLIAAAVVAVLALGGGDDSNQPEAAVVEPIAPREYMVLVAQLEPLGGVAERDVTRFIVDDLEHTIGRDVPFSQIRLRTYPQVITSEADAQAAAQANHAAVIVWGNYDPDAVDLEIQVGATTAFPYNAFPRQTLEKTGNVRVRMTDERRESVALPVIGVLNVLDMADGDQFEFVLGLTLIAVLDVQSGEITGGDVSAHLHRALVAYIEDPPRAVRELDNALVLDGGNPLLYAYRAVMQVRAGNVAAAELDIQTAERLGPDGWAMPAYFSGGSTPEAALEYIERVIELRPDDWFAYFAGGILAYTDLNDPAAAKALLEQSLALGPEASMPYVPSMLIALREGRVADAQNFARIILTDFPDPELIILAYSTLYGEAGRQAQFTSAYFSTATNIVLGQYARVIQEMVAIEEAVAALPDDQAVSALADMFLFQGLAYCNLDEFAQAEAAYSRAIRFDDDFTLLYALRGQVRLALGTTADAENDFQILRAHHRGAAFDAWVEAALAGEWTCVNFFDYQLPR